MLQHLSKKTKDGFLSPPAEVPHLLSPLLLQSQKEKKRKIASSPVYIPTAGRPYKAHKLMTHLFFFHSIFILYIFFFLPSYFEEKGIILFFFFYRLETHYSRHQTDIFFWPLCLVFLRSSHDTRTQQKEKFYKKEAVRTVTWLIHLIWVSTWNASKKF